MNARLLTGLACGTLIASAARAEPPRVIDTSSYQVYQGERALGTETFSFESRGDSLTIFSHVIQNFPRPDGGDIPIDKQMVLVVRSLDYELRFYQSQLKVNGRDLTRGLVMNDTLFTAYRESDGRGIGDRLVRPPGRVFVVDAQLFVLFDVMCRNLYGKTFDRRTLPVIVLGERDSIMEISATDLGTETIRWGARPIVARKLRFADNQTTFLAWVGPQGYMLRLEEPAGNLRVEREAPAFRRSARRPPAPDGN